jgi:hypothetical protein
MAFTKLAKYNIILRMSIKKGTKEAQWLTAMGFQFKVKSVTIEHNLAGNCQVFEKKFEEVNSV